jgi:hypothetical protein
MNRLAMTQNKICKTCNELKCSTEFHKHKVNPDGLRASCKACTNKRQAQRDAVRRWEKSRTVRSREEIHEARRNAAMEGI